MKNILGHDNIEIRNMVDNIYPKRLEIEVPIEYVDEKNMVDYSCDSAVKLQIDIKYSNYTKNDVSKAIKVACLKCLEVFD